MCLRLSWEIAVFSTTLARCPLETTFASMRNGAEKINKEKSQKAWRARGRGREAIDEML